MFCPFEIFSSADALRQRLAAKAAKQRKEKENAASAIVEDASEVESEVAEVSNATEVVVEDEVANAPAQPVAGGKVKAETKWYQAMWFKGVLFFSIVPICFLLPFTIEYIVDYTRAYMDHLRYVWMVYAAIVVFFYFTKTKHTNDSFFTQLLTWVLFALGFHAMTGFFNFLAPPDRLVVMKLWGTVTFIPYAIIVYFDDTDYKKRESTEALKEKKRKEKSALHEEKVKAARRLRKQQLQAFELQTADDATESSRNEKQ